METWIEQIKRIYRLQRRISTREVTFIRVLWLDRLLGGMPQRDFSFGYKPRTDEEREQVITGMKWYLVPSTALSWIKANDTRQLHLLSRLIDTHFPKQDHPLLQELDTRAKLIAQIDTAEIQLEEKLDLITKLRAHYQYVKQEDKIFDRLKGKQEQIKCLYVTEWLAKKQKIRLPTALVDYTQVIDAFDENNMFRKDKIACMEAVCNRLAQSKYKESQIKSNLKQVNFYLPEKIKSHLKQMAIEKGLSQGQIIQILIEDAWNSK